MIMEASERRTFQFFQLKLCKRGNLFCRNGIQMENGLDLGAEVPRINFFVAPSHGTLCSKISFIYQHLLIISSG